MTESKGYRDRDVLKEMYHRRGLTQTEIADEFGVSQKTISNWLDKNGIEPKHNIGQGVRTDGRDNPATFGTYKFNQYKGGYEMWMDHKSNKFVRVHRLLAVSEYGFEAVKGMDVHHINEISWDNRPDNIELMSHSDHMSLHSSKKNSEAVAEVSE